jgi:hypothetical protein
VTRSSSASGFRLDRTARYADPSSDRRRADRALAPRPLLPALSRPAPARHETATRLYNLPYHTQYAAMPHPLAPIPRLLRQRAVVCGKEGAWAQTDALAAIETLAAQQLAVLGGEV